MRHKELLEVVEKTIASVVTHAYSRVSYSELPSAGSCGTAVTVVSKSSKQPLRLTKRIFPSPT